MYDLKGLSKKQLEIMQKALENYTRLLSGQLKIAIEPIDIFTDVYDKLNTKQRALIRTIHEDYDYDEMYGHTIDGEISWDIMQVIRHQLWKDGDRKNYQVASSVLEIGTEKLPKIMSSKESKILDKEKK